MNKLTILYEDDFEPMIENIITTVLDYLTTHTLKEGIGKGVAWGIKKTVVTDNSRKVLPSGTIYAYKTRTGITIRISND